MIKHIDPQEALRLINEDTLLIAVREPDEHPRERIPNAGLIPLSVFPLRWIGTMLGG